MTDDAAKVRKLLRQQAAIANFGSFALRQSDLMTILAEAARVCADSLGVSFAKICRYRDQENDLLVEAGFGWRDGVVGNVVSRADESSPQGRAFITGEPSISNDLRKDNMFVLPAFYAAHGIVSTVDVLIKGAYQPYGVLEIDNDRQHDYDEHDINFLTAFANVLAEAVATSERTALLQTTVEQMRILVEDRSHLVSQLNVLVESQDRLLDQKKILAEELQHRVRNNLQLVYGMLSRQLEETTDEGGQRGLRAIARRVSTLAQVYDHLLGTEMSRTTDFGGYVKSLCLSLAEIQTVTDRAVTLTCESDAIILDLDMVTALGIVVTELVTNSFDHAFPNGDGTIAVSVRRDGEEGETSAALIIRDNGSGFIPQAGSKRHGLGLVRRLIEQVRGTVSVNSDQGTTWTITFPIAATVDTIDPLIAA
jgi:two-component sensor histidine kinase